MQQPLPLPDAPLRGLWCATLTPLHATGVIHNALLHAHIQRLFSHGVDGVVLFGTTGEGPSFSVVERCSTLEMVLAAGIGPDRLVTAAGCAALSDTVALVRHALSSGCARCLVLPPFFWKGLSSESVYVYYANLIERVADPTLRLYLYHFPQMSGIAIQPDLLARLAADYPGIVAGLKDSSGDFRQTMAFLQCAPELSILVGQETDIPRLMQAGGSGTICGAANLYPKLVRALLEPDVSSEDVTRLATLLRVLAPYPFVPSFKAVLAAQTGDTAWRHVQPPLLPLSDETCHELSRTLNRYALRGDAARDPAGQNRGADMS